MGSAASGGGGGGAPLAAKFARIDAAVSRRGFAVMLALRLAPTPFPALNYLFGLTSVGVRDFALATFFGYAPGTLMVVASGATARAALGGDGGARARAPLVPEVARVALARAVRGAQPWWWYPIAMAVASLVACALAAIVHTTRDVLRELDGEAS